MRTNSLIPKATSVHLANVDDSLWSSPARLSKYNVHTIVQPTKILAQLVFSLQFRLQLVYFHIQAQIGVDSLARTHMGLGTVREITLFDDVLLSLTCPMFFYSKQVTADLSGLRT
jgi:hypothetical protein